MADLKRERFINLMISEIFENYFFPQCKKYLKGKLIDIGCGVKPYKTQLSSIVEEHIGVDHEGTSHDKSEINLFGTAYSIPTDNNTFDSAICTAVLEHLEEPEQAIRECYRVLKPGGVAIYSVPFIWHQHEVPRDFFRYSSYGLKYLFEKVGFEIIEIKPLSGFAVTFLQLHIYIINGKFNKGIIRKLKVLDAYIWLCHKIGLWFNKRDNTTDWSWMFVATVRKN
jgi:SAM-dependent methyltransferase